jgi:GT2 family glycosyltransferase
VDISIVLLNYNSSHFTLQCVDSIIRQTNPELAYEIIIIDNNSSIEEYNKLKVLEQHTKINIFRSHYNLGFSGGNMLGVQFCHNPSYYAFINNDCTLVNDCLGILKNFLDQKSDATIVCGQMYNSNIEHWASFNYFPSIARLILGKNTLHKICPYKYPDIKSVYTSPLKVDLVSGSFMFINAQHFSEIGGFDTNYFLYCEEEDLCMTMKKKNLMTFLVPEAKFIHFGGQSSVKNFDLEREFYISLFYFFRKHYSAFHRFLLAIVYFIKLLFKSYKSLNYMKLAIFLLAGAPMKYSMRFSHKLE